MRVIVSHTTRLDYEAEVIEGVVDVRLGPFSDEHQRWNRYDLAVAPMGSVRRYADGFGNAAHLVTVARPHAFIALVSGGEVETLLSDPFALPLVAPPPLEPSDLADYLAPSTLIPRHDEIGRLAEPFRFDDPSRAFEAVQGLMGLVHDQFSYQQHVTTVATTVPDVLEGRSGVCQDFAHVLIGLSRAIGVPTRYVSGYIVVRGGPGSSRPDSQQRRAWQMRQLPFQGQDEGAPGAERPEAATAGQDEAASGGGGPTRGAGASHAWVEAFTPTHGWRGFDPTNNLVASTWHVKMAIGRDYADVPPTRGSYRGTAEERLTVDVAIRVLG